MPIWILIIKNDHLQPTSILSTVGMQHTKLTTSDIELLNDNYKWPANQCLLLQYSDPIQCSSIIQDSWHLQELQIYGMLVWKCTPTAVTKSYAYKMKW